MAAALIPIAAGLATSVIPGLLGTGAKAGQRTSDIQAMYNQGDVQGLEGWINDIPPHPDASNAEAKAALGSLETGAPLPPGSGLSGGGGPVPGITTGGASGLGSAASTALQAANAIQAAQDFSKQQALQSQSLQTATDSYNQKAQLRGQSIQGLEQGAAPDLSADFATPSNPFTHAAASPTQGIPSTQGAAPLTAATPVTPAAPVAGPSTAAVGGLLGASGAAVHSPLGTGTGAMPGVTANPIIGEQPFSPAANPRLVATGSPAAAPPPPIPPGPPMQSIGGAATTLPPVQRPGAFVPPMGTGAPVGGMLGGGTYAMQGL